MLGRALRMAFWVTYDHLGKLILANIVCALAVCVPAMLAYGAILTNDPVVQLVVGVPLLVLALGVVLPVVTAGLAYLANELIDARDGAFADLFTGIRLYWRRAIALGQLCVIAVGCLVTSTWFYAAMLRDTLPWLGFTISALALWCLVFVSLVSLMALPALVQKRGGVLETVKLSALLVLDNPLFLFGLGIQLLALAVVSVIIAPLLFFLSGSAAVVLAMSAYEQLARKYALREVQKAGRPVPEGGLTLEGVGGGIRVVSRGGVLVIDEAEDDYLNRGLRDFIFPWKG